MEGEGEELSKLFAIARDGRMYKRLINNEELFNSINY